MSSDLPLVQAEHTALTADALLEQAVQLLIAARKGGWKISSVIQGDFQKRDHIRLDMWREPPPAESGGPVSTGGKPDGSAPPATAEQNLHPDRLSTSDKPSATRETP